MKFNIRDKFNAFITNSKDYPMLSGLIVGLYAFLFYYSNNFEIANSVPQVLFFALYYILFPISGCFIVDRVIAKTPLRAKKRQVLFVLVMSFFMLLVGRNIDFHHSYVKVFCLFLFLTVVLSFIINNHKIVISLILIMTLFPFWKLGNIIYANGQASQNWLVQPDSILDCKFKKTPNIYYIQVDGYTNIETLKNKIYNYDNSKFDNWLSSKGFTHYSSFRSNYDGTLKSNSSCFTMKHHYSDENSNTKNARDYILGDNTVLKILKNNHYKTFFISEKPYLLMNRPKIEYDYCNFDFDEIPFLKDGWSINKEITNELKSQIIQNRNSRNFYFIEKFSPGHIGVYSAWSEGKAKERVRYLENIETANHWLKKVIPFIEKNDPNAVILIGADHGGFVGFDYTLQAVDKIKDADLLNSIFGAKLAIKWNGNQHSLYDYDLKSSVNLFRTVFSFLSQDSELLKAAQENGSYNTYDLSDQRKIYKAIE